jgi:ABC-type amino acid transport substrate-binding protein
MHLRIGFINGFPPFTFMAGDRPSGPVIDVVQAVLKLARYSPFSFEPLELDRAEDALLAGEVDALAFTAVISERRERLAFSRPLLATGAALFAPRGSPTATHGDIRLCSGLRVATPRAGPLPGAIRRHCAGALLVLTRSYQESFQYVVEGQADLAALNFHVGREIVEQFPGRFAEPAQSFEWMDMAIAVSRKRQDGLLASLSQAIETMELQGALEPLRHRFALPPRILNC